MLEEKIKEIDKFIGNAEYKKAQEEISKLSKKTNISANDELSLLHRTCIIFEQLGEYTDLIKTAKVMITKSKEDDNPLREIDALLAEIYGNYRLNKIETALKLVEELDKLIDQCNIDGVNKRKVKLLEYKVFIYADKGQADQAYIFAQESYIFSREIEDQYYLSRSYYAQGWALMHIGDRDKAIENFEMSLKIEEAIGNQYSIAYSAFALGFNWKSKGRFDKGQDYLLRCLKIREKIGNKQDLVWTLLNLGDIYYEDGDIHNSQTYYENSLLISQETDYWFGIVFSLMQLAIIFEDLEDPQLVLDTLEKALTYAKRIEIVDPEVHVLYSLISYITKNKLKQINIKSYISRLEEISYSSKTKIFDQVYRLSKALILRISENSKNRKKAKVLLHQIIDEDVIDFNYTKIALLNYGEILVEDLKKYFEEDVIETQFTELTDILTSEQIHSVYSTIAQRFIDQSRLALEEIDFEKAKQLIKRVENLFDFLELYNKGPTPFRIIYILFVKERNLNELSKILRITKGALSSQLKLLIKLDLVKVSREEQVRSATMLKKYYSLSSKGIELIQPLELNLKDNIRNNLEIIDKEHPFMMVPRLKMKMIRDSTLFVDKYQDYIEEVLTHNPLAQLEKNTVITNTNDEICNLFDESDEIKVNHFFLTDNQYDLYMKLWDDFVEKVQNEVVKTKPGTTENQCTEKPKLVSHLTLPIGKLMTLEQILEAQRKEKISE